MCLSEAFFLSFLLSVRGYQKSNKAKISSQIPLFSIFLCGSVPFFSFFNPNSYQSLTSLLSFCAFEYPSPFSYNTRYNYIYKISLWYSWSYPPPPRLPNSSFLWFAVPIYFFLPIFPPFDLSIHLQYRRPRANCISVSPPVSPPVSPCVLGVSGKSSCAVSHSCFAVGEIKRGSFGN